jgi:DNA-binding response OmpR family regulator
MERPAPSVLVVEDDDALRTLCRVVLELDGFAVREARSVEEARTALHEAEPSVVLLDVHLGRETTDVLFVLLRQAGVPVAAVTGTADLDDYRDRADAVLAKPFAPDALIATARRLARGDGE